MKQHEANLAMNISHFLKTQYKDTIFRYDIADIKLTMPQAIRMKKLQMAKRGYPDLLILEARNGFNGLFIELKKDYDAVFTKQDKMRTSKHIQEQHEMHELLRAKGYKVVWGLGFRDTIEKIKDYLK